MHIVSEVMKLQRPLFCSDDDHYNDILFYNESRTVEATVPMRDDQIEEVFGDKYKVYWLCSYEMSRKPQKLNLLERVKDMDW